VVQCGSNDWLQYVAERKDLNGFRTNQFKAALCGGEYAGKFHNTAHSIGVAATTTTGDVRGQEIERCESVCLDE
jgi:hypothetical protein